MSYLDKLAKIEALLQRASSEGERQAAAFAKERILGKISDIHKTKPIEYKVSLESFWKKRLFTTICAKHGYQTYRYSRQKRTTTNLKIAKSVMDEILWPEFLKYAELLEELVEEIMKDLTQKIHQVQGEETEISGEISLGG